MSLETELYEVEFSYKATGIAPAISEIESLQNRLNELVASGKVSEESMESMGRQLNTLGDAAKSQEAKFGSLSTSLRKMMTEMRAAAQVAQGDTMSSQWSLRSNSLMGSFDADELRSWATALENAQFSVGAVKTKVDQLTASESRLAATRKKADYDYDVQQYGRLEASVRRLAAAEQDYNTAKTAQTGAYATKDINEMIQANKQLEAAERELKSARAENTAAQDQQARIAAQAQAKVTAENAKLEASEKRLNSALRDADYSQRVRDAGSLEASTKRLAEAETAYRTAQANVRAADASGDITAQVKARDQLTAATKELQTSQTLYAAANDKAAAVAAKAAAQQAADQAKLQKQNDALTAAIQKRQQAEEDAKFVQASGSSESLSAALDRLAGANNKVALAYKARSAAMRSGDVAQMTAAENQLTAALKTQTSAQNAANRAVQDSIERLPRMRYALYDISQTLALVGAGFTAVSVGATATAVSMESDFANVVRTTGVYLDETGTEVQNLRQDFEDLYTSMPTSWGDLTDVGTLAGQLGIASEDVTDFTELVTKFAATTDVSAEDAATAFGRLSALLNVSADEYENLGSSILAVGVKSIAAEPDIIAIAEQIAGVAGAAGMTADEVFGLSAALASIGTAPELSRGIVTRLFTNITTAVTEGGEALDAFAQAANMDAQTFATAWETDAAGAIMALMQSIGNLTSSEQVAALQNIGVDSVRDLPALLKLAQNYDLLAASMGYAADGYAEGTALSEQYGVIAETTASKLTELANTAKTLYANLGVFTDVLNGVISLMTGFLKSLNALASNPTGKVILVITTALFGLAGAVGVLIAALTRGYASFLGVKQVLRENASSMNVFAVSSQAATASLLQLINATRIYLSTGKQVTITNGQIVAGMAATQAGTAAAATAARGLSLALKGIGLASGIGIVLSIAGALVEHFSAAEEAAEDLLGTADDLSAALKADSAADYTGQVFRKLSTSADEATTSAQSMAGALSGVEGAASTASDAVDAAADSVSNYSMVVGENTFREMVDNFVNNDDLRNALKENEALLEQAGFSADEYVKQVAMGAGTAYIEKIKQNVNAMRDALIEAASAEVDAGGTARPWYSSQWEDVQALGSLSSVFDTLTTAASDFETGLQGVAEKSAIVQQMLATHGIATDEVTASTEDATSAVEDFLDAFRDGSGDLYETQDAIYGVLEALIQNGTGMDAFSESGRENFAAISSALDQMASIAGNDLSVFGTNVVNMLAQLEGAGITTGSSVEYLRSVMIAAFNQAWGLNLDTSAANQGIEAFLDNVIAALRAKAQLEAREITYSVVPLKTPPMMRGALDRAVAENLTKTKKATVTYNQDVIDAYNQQIAAVLALKDSLNTTQAAGTSAGNAIRNSMNNAGRSTDHAADRAKDAAEELYTLTDYANDLADIWSRAFDIRFSGQQTYDDITSKVRAMAEAFEEAEQKVKELQLDLQELNADLAGLQADLSKQEYFLSIALEYGDTARAEEIQATIAELQSDIASKQSDVADTAQELTEAQNKASRALTGNSAAAIQNREDVLDLVQAYQDHIQALADSGMGADELKAKTEALRQKFIEQGTQLGFSRTELSKYEAAFRDVKVAIDNVPRDITVHMGANTDPATQAVNEWLARKRSTTVDVAANVGNVSGGTYYPSSIYSSGPASVSKLVTREASTVSSWGGGGSTHGRMLFQASGGLIPEYHATGGIGGLHPGAPRGTDTVPAWLTPGEYVMQRKATQYYGADFMEALNRQQVPRFFTTGGSTSNEIMWALAGSNSGVLTASLTAGTIQAIAHAVKPLLFLDGQQVAQSTAKANSMATAVGSN